MIIISVVKLLQILHEGKEFMNNKIDSKKLLLLLLYLQISVGENDKTNIPIKGSTRLQKMMFIYEKEIHEKYDFTSLIEYEPEFFAFNYGPFSSKVLDDVRFLSNTGFILEKNLNAISDVQDSEFAEYENFEFNGKIIESESLRDNNYIEYTLSDKGMKFVESRILETVRTKPELIKTLINFKYKIVNMPLMSIIRYVYTKYPDMTVNSRIKDDI